MRLLVVYQHAPTPGAPGIYRHRMLLAELVHRGWDVDLVSSPINYMDGRTPAAYAGRGYVREEIDGIVHHWVRATDDVHRSMRRRARNYVSFARSATIRGMRLPRPDVVWASSPPLSVAAAGRLIARRHRAALALEVRDIWPESAAAAGLLDPDGRLYRAIDARARAYARAADVCIVPTPGLVEGMAEHGATDCRVVTGALEDVPPDPAVRARVREELGIPADACVAAYVGAHGIVNDLGTLLDALELLEDGTRDLHVITAGAGSALDQLWRRLEARPIARLHVLGAVPKPRARELLAAADVGLHLLRPDPVFESALPTKVLEYLGCHLPFVTTVPGVPSTIADLTGGSFADGAEGLASALRQWAAMPADQRRRRGDDAFAWGAREYGLDASVDALEAALHAAIERHGPQLS